MFKLPELNTKLNKKSILLATGAGLLILMALGGSFYVGYTRGLAEPKVVSLDLKNIASTSTVDFNTFWQAWGIIKDKALKGEQVGNQELVYGAIRGLINSLDDPHSVFLAPSDAKQFQDDINGSFGGVGMEIGKKDGSLVIVAPLKDTPADAAGLRANDRILKIDDTVTDELDVEQAVKLIRGQVDTIVTLSIFRDGWSAAKEFKLIRAMIDVPTLNFEIKEGNLAYLQLNTFNEKAPRLFYEALQKATEARAQGIILDLRDNPGGYLEVAVNLAEYFVDNGRVIVSERYRTGKEDQFKSSGSGALKGLPIVILINGGSASAAEILAGALRNLDNAKLIGENTFGKGTVQILQSLSDGSTLKVTVANWVLPDGTIIEKNGLKPDIEVKLTDDDIKNKKDPQLDTAIAELKKEISK